MELPLSIADILVQELASLGCTQAFTVTGGAIMHLSRALHESPSIHVTYNHHESACAMAAEGYAKLSGKPAIVALTSGPGALNALNGVFGSFTDSVPMIILAGQVRTDTITPDNSNLRQLGDQELRTDLAVRGIVKGLIKVSKQSKVEDVASDAYALAVSGRPGPVWIEIPIDIQGQKGHRPRSPEHISPKKAQPKSQHKWTSRDELAEITHLLNESRRPVILAGTGVRIAGAIELLGNFAKRINFPVLSAWTHDVFDNESPLYFGRPGTIGTRDANLIIQQADLILVLGSRLNLRQVSYNHQSFAENAFLIHVDIDPNELAKNFPKRDLAVLADVRDFLEQLVVSESLHWNRSDLNDWLARCAHVRKVFRPRESDYITSGELNPYVFISRLFSASPSGTSYVCGNASACIIPFQIGKLKSSQRMFSNSGSASMGYDLPAAIGAALADRSRTTLAICGDGSFVMNIQELATLVQEDLDLRIVILDNDGYLSMRQTQDNFFDTRFGSSKSTGLFFPDFSRVSEAYGIPHIQISNENLDDAIREFWRTPGPILAVAKVDPAQEFEPRLKSKSIDGAIVTPRLDDMYPFLPEDDLRELRNYLLGNGGTVNA